MKITYLGHSGFLIEWKTCYWLFDYYRGNLPGLDAGKKLFVLVSHKHEDHYNTDIFRLYEKYNNIEYVLSSDIKPGKGQQLIKNSSDLINDRIHFVKPSTEYTFYDNNDDRIQLKTLKSTDCGVAFLLQYHGKTIYHAGDLNLWVWKEESKQYNNNMTANFNKEMQNLVDVTIDVAFVPLDPRQEEWYAMGMESLLSTAKVNYVFPMHFWDKPSIIREFLREKGRKYENTVILNISQDGQEWDLLLEQEI